MVVSPHSVLAAEVIGAAGGQSETAGAVLWCDGRRKVELPPGSRVEVRRGAMPVLLARLPAVPGAEVEDRRAVHRPAGREVRPAGGGLARPGRREPSEHGQATRALPAGRQTRSQAAMLEEVRITGLGVIDEAVLELSAGFNVVTGETGAGKTMVVSGLGPAVRRPGRPGPGPAGRRPGRRRGPAAGRPGRAGRPAGQRLRRRSGRRRQHADPGPVGQRRGPVPGDGRRPVGAGVPADLPGRRPGRRARSGRSAAAAAARPAARRRLTGSAGRSFAELLASYQRAYHRHQQVRAELTELTTLARERAREADDLRRGLEEIERAEPAEGEDIELRAEDERLANADALHSAATTAHEALLGDPSSGTYDAADVVYPAGRGQAGAGGGGAARPAPGRAGGPGLRGRLPASPMWPPSWPPTRSRSRPTRSGWPSCRSAGPS